MKTNIISILLATGAILLNLTHLQGQQKGYSLTVKVSDLKNANGHVQVTLYNEEGSIPDHDYKRYYELENAEITSNSASVTFHGLAKGTYAVNILHDEDKDGEIDKGFILPVEGIGFSNFETIGLRNRPNFKKASFELTTDQTMEITVVYM